MERLQVDRGVTAAWYEKQRTIFEQFSFDELFDERAVDATVIMLPTRNSGAKYHLDGVVGSHRHDLLMRVVKLVIHVDAAPPGPLRFCPLRPRSRQVRIP